eukprot:TRINITY_DN985_c0_g3_i1.p1 TRINITY_DN985_c0_g3~~TRINITY_DN985_c0_g3_i1.p1  ORF type:complete len:478 (-),score=175.73 TRINITY_DN985_c0_g3_i1:135-1568(-)
MTAMQNFASAPQAVGTRQKYRDPHDSMGGSRSGNIMNDRRVVRGNTYGSAVEPQKQPDAGEIAKQREAQRRRLARANQTKKRPITPEATAGRKHMDMQTDSYLEELTERAVEFEAETQTDFLLDRPPSPLFMPAKIGVDVDTQIEEGELFDFDNEVEPVLEVLVGKSLEQGMMEVLEEAELDSLRQHQEEFERKRNAELLEVQRMEAAEKRRSDELRRRLQQQSQQRERDLCIMKKVVCRGVASAHMSSLKERALAHLLDASVFSHSGSGVVENVIMQELIQSVCQQATSGSDSHQMVSQMAKARLTARRAAHQGKLDMEKERLRVVDEAERQAREEKRQEKLAREAEEKRLEEERKCMDDYEQYQPPEPVKETGIIESYDEETREVLLSDGSKALVAEKDVEQLKELLAQDLSTLDPPDQRVMGTCILPFEGEEEAVKTISEFRVEVPPAPEPPAEGEGEGGEAAEGEGGEAPADE